MTPVSQADMISGEYYLCYEKFEDSANIAISGKYVNNSLIPAHNHGEDVEVWYIYEAGISVFFKTQEIFLLDKEEVIRNIVLEII